MDFADTGRFPAENSAYLQFLADEKAEIDRVKWLESEKLGRDIGQDYGNWIWVMAGHRERWISGLKAAGRYPL